jgi:uncharacterized protein GlcG (DUF336 family)
MHEQAVLDHAEALAMVEAMLKAAQRITGQPLGIAVVDDRGELLAFALMDGGTPLARQYSIKKAYTASRIHRDLRDFAAYRQAVGRQVIDFADPNLVGSARGGIVIRDPRSERVLGAIGVSGGTPDEDEEVARLGLAAVTLA